jgi:hypothetical protein
MGVWGYDGTKTWDGGQRDPDTHKVVGDVHLAQLDLAVASVCPFKMLEEMIKGTAELHRIQRV